MPKPKKTNKKKFWYSIYPYIWSTNLAKRTGLNIFLSDFMVTKHFETLRGKLAGFSIFPLRGFINGCHDHTQTSGFESRDLNLSDRPIELQIRVGSILKKVHTLKPCSSKRLKCKSIYKAYMPNRSGSTSSGGMKSNITMMKHVTFTFGCTTLELISLGWSSSNILALRIWGIILRIEFPGIIKEAACPSARNPGLVFVDFSLNLYSLCWVVNENQSLFSCPHL